MKLQICAIYDSKAEAWLNPMVFQSNGQALRSFEDAVKNTESDFGRHPEDYSLFLLGSFEQRNGEIQVQVPMVHLANGMDVVQTMEVVK